MLKLQNLSGLVYTKYNIIKGIVTVFYYIHYAWIDIVIVLKYIIIYRNWPNASLNSDFTPIWMTSFSYSTPLFFV